VTVPLLSLLVGVRLLTGVTGLSALRVEGVVSDLLLPGQAVPTGSAESAERLLPASVGVDLEADQFDRADGRQLSDH
jgi:hypothetical protein